MHLTISVLVMIERIPISGFAIIQLDCKAEKSREEINCQDVVSTEKLSVHKAICGAL